MIEKSLSHLKVVARCFKKILLLQIVTIPFILLFYIMQNWFSQLLSTNKANAEISLSAERKGYISNLFLYWCHLVLMENDMFLTYPTYKLKFQSVCAI